MNHVESGGQTSLSEVFVNGSLDILGRGACWNDEAPYLSPKAPVYSHLASKFVCVDRVVYMHATLNGVSICNLHDQINVPPLIQANNTTNVIQKVIVIADRERRFNERLFRVNIVRFVSNSCISYGGRTIGNGKRILQSFIGKRREVKRSYVYVSGGIVEKLKKINI
jgi:hypothetical protein